MYAVMVKDEYSDICLGHAYDVERVFADGHIKLTNSPRRYNGNCFRIYDKSKIVSLKEAYRRYRLEQVKKRLGIK